jgi:FKBP-type peptidyl-prolyl cis-trans isomerase FklB
MSVKPLFPTKTLLLASFLAGGLLLGYGQSQTNQSGAKPAPKKSGATTAKTEPAAAASALDTPKAKLSYAIGADLGNKLRAQSIDIDPAILHQAMLDAIAGNKARMTDDEIHTALVDLSNQLRQKQMAQLKELGEKNKKDGETFLAENKTKEGVVALPSGLQYKILKTADGKKPTASDTVVCNYRGTLINGKEFDSSEKHNGPATFPVNGVIKGWTEALQLMPVGSKWELFIPSDLAYGERGAGADIAPNSTLIFDVELLSIKEKDTAAQEKPAQDKATDKQ